MSETRQRGKRKFVRLKEVHQTRQGLVCSYLAFTLMFGALRLLTYLIHNHVDGLGDVTTGGVHLHHYVWGIAILMLVGFSSLFQRPQKWEARIGSAFGVGMALVVDEFALLLNLKDVYWDHQGRWSVDLALGLIGVAGFLLALTHPDSTKPRQPKTD